MNGPIILGAYIYTLFSKENWPFTTSFPDLRTCIAAFSILTHRGALLPHHNNAEILENAITAGLDSC